MMKRLALRALYAVHMLAPLALVEWHIERLSQGTLEGLRSLCGG